MTDPNNEIKGDLDEAAKLRWQESRENDPTIKQGLEQAARGYEAEATELENEVGSEENPE